MALTTTLSSVWTRAKAWLTRNEPEIVDQLWTGLVPGELGFASFDEKSLLVTASVKSMGKLISQWIRKDQRPRITAIPQGNQQWLVVDVPKRPPKQHNPSRLKIHTTVTSDWLAQRFAMQGHAQFISFDALPWPRKKSQTGVNGCLVPPKRCMTSHAFHFFHSLPGSNTRVMNTKLLRFDSSAPPTIAPYGSANARRFPSGNRFPIRCLNCVIIPICLTPGRCNAMMP